MKAITNTMLVRLLDFLSEHEEFVFLDTARCDAVNTVSMLFLNPADRLQYRLGDDIEGFFKKAQAFLNDGFFLAGWIGYEFGYVLEGVLRNLLRREGDSGRLLADLGVFRRCRTFDHRSGRTDFPGGGDAEQALPECCVADVTPSQEREDYLRAIRKILDYIKAGDTYQVNYTLKLHFRFSGSAERLYSELRRNQSVSYGAYIRRGDERILSFSPELFFKKEADSVIVRPMKGTLQRGRTPAEDALQRDFLAADIKNRSENVMIVDLLRNDLGRLMHFRQSGDVRVRSLFDVEVYETLLQMTSTIAAEATTASLANIPLMEVFKALFPCGSVTGAPKIRTMQIIDELEGDRRGVYTGAIGYLAPGGAAMFNVPIRTVVLQDGRGEMGIGSGIVHDSDPEQEWQECLLKGRFLTAPVSAFELIETLLYDPREGYLLLPEHLHRLAASAAYFLFSCDSEHIRSELLSRCADFGGNCMRVRLTLAKDGMTSIAAAPCNPPLHVHLPEEVLTKDAGMPAIAFSLTRTDAQSPFYFHKTTRRQLYDREFAEASRRGLYDICFCNTAGEVTEGCVTNLLCLKDGVYSTPPIRCGLLPGVMRERLLQDPRRPLREKVLTMDDIRAADALFLCNSVRGVVQVRLQEG